MLKQVHSPEGLSIYLRSDGSYLKEILRVSNNYRGKLNFTVYYYRPSGEGSWENRDHKLWCHLCPNMLVEWKNEESA